jgi:hypothetical protein
MSLFGSKTTNASMPPKDSENPITASSAAPSTALSPKTQVGSPNKKYESPYLLRPSVVLSLLKDEGGPRQAPRQRTRPRSQRQEIHLTPILNSFFFLPTSFFLFILSLPKDLLSHISSLYSLFFIRYSIFAIHY